MFRCPDCGYAVEISGGLDYGFTGVTQTILCKECKELYDISLEVRAPEMCAKEHEEGKPWRPSEDELYCPEDDEHKVRAWKHPGKCPRCGGKMMRENLTINWD